MGFEIRSGSICRTPHRSNYYKSPLEVFAPNLNYDVNQIKRFGCLAYWSIQRKPDSKFSTRAVRGVLVGYTASGYIFLNPESGKFFESRNVRFNEKMVYGDKYKNESIKDWPDTETVQSKNEWFLKFEDDDVNKLVNDCQFSGSEGEVIRKHGRPSKRQLETEGDLNDTNKRQKLQPTTVRDPYNTRSRKIINTSFSNFVEVFSFSENYEFPSIEEEFLKTKDNECDKILYWLHAKINDNPETCKQALESNHKDEWLNAIDDELNSLKRNKVWILVDRPKFGKNCRKPNIIDSKWVFKQKEDGSNVTKYKERLVIRGFKDTNLYDLKETYALVSRLTLVRSVLATINFYDLEVCQLDVKTAFLNGIIEDEVYIEIPEGIIVSEEVANSKGLTNDQYDPCLFTCNSGKTKLILLIYVDDILLASNDMKLLSEIKIKLMNAFEMTDLKNRSFS